MTPKNSGLAETLEVEMTPHFNVWYEMYCSLIILYVSYKLTSRTDIKVEMSSHFNVWCEMY